MPLHFPSTPPLFSPSPAPPAAGLHFLSTSPPPLGPALPLAVPSRPALGRRRRRRASLPRPRGSPRPRRTPPLPARAPAPREAGRCRSGEPPARARAARGGRPARLGPKARLKRPRRRAEQGPATVPWDPRPSFSEELRPVPRRGPAPPRPAPALPAPPGPEPPEAGASWTGGDGRRAWRRTRRRGQKPKGGSDQKCNTSRTQRPPGPGPPVRGRCRGPMGVRAC